MASISKEPGGRKRIQFIAADGGRKSIRLGKVTQKQAEEVCRRVEYLAAAVTSGLPLDADTARWVASVGDDLAAKLARVGLIAQRQGAKLGAFLDDFMAKREGIKKNTWNNFDQTRRRLLDFFPAELDLRDITPGKADDWLLYLQGRGYAPATIGRTVKRARQFFRAAVRKKLLAENPFAEVKAPSQENRARNHFVPLDVAEKVLAACPDVEWRLIFALCRYGGLRCPSELLNLTWETVNWEAGRFRVHAPKTERHKTGGERLVPIFPELRPHLEEAFEQAAEGAVHVIARYRGDNANLRTQLLRIIRRAGVKPWPRIFQNLRATRETELAQSYPLHVVCEWIGNSPAIAARHYLQVTEADFERAAGKGGAECGAGAVRNEVQHQATTPAVLLKDSGQTQRPLNNTAGVVIQTDSVNPCSVPLLGLETPAASPDQPSSLRKSPPRAGAESGSLSAGGASGPADAGLARVVAAWPTLPAEVRAAVLALIEPAQRGR